MQSDRRIPLPLSVARLTPGAKLLMLERANARIRYLTWGQDPVAFAHDCIEWPEGQGLTPYQEEGLAALVERGRESIRAPHGAGKSCDAALAVLWFALTRDGVCDWKAPMTASAWRQLTEYLLPEIHKWARRLRWDRLRRDPFDARTELLDRSLKLSTGTAFSMASSDPAHLEGAHADSVLVVFDEAKAIPDGTWDALEGIFAGDHAAGEAYALAISTPAGPSGRFWEIHARRPGYEQWGTRWVKLEEAVAAGRISQTWADERRRAWGEHSSLYRCRVLGEFGGSEDGLIPLAWIEAAMDRWRERYAAGWDPEAVGVIGADIADQGADSTVLALGAGMDTVELRIYETGDTMAHAGRIVAALRSRALAVVDTIGVGAGVAARVREQGRRIEGFNASERTDRRDRTGEFGFMNKRTAGWWALRELLDPEDGEDIALPPDDMLLGELAAAERLPETSTGRIRISSTDDMKAKLGRSPDRASAVVMRYWGARSRPMRTNVARLISARV